MRIGLQVILLIFMHVSAGCEQHHSENKFQDALARSLPHDASIKPPVTVSNYTHDLTAEGSNWSVTVRWNPGELTRWVKWQEGNDGFTLVIPLRNRPEPFKTEFWGMTPVTRYGPYQPACVHRQAGADWHVTMSHEQADFPTEADLTKMLKISIPGQHHTQPVLSPDGIMVTLSGPSFSGTTSLDVKIFNLTVNGRPPSPAVLNPFLTGKVIIKSNQQTNGAQ